MTGPPAPVRRPRPRWPLAALLVVGALAAASTFAWSSSGGEFEAAVAAADPVRVAAAQHALETLPVPADAHRDPYATACGVPSPYCLTADAGTPEGLLAEVTGLLRAAGAKVVDRDCHPRVELEPPGRCHTVLALDGVRVGLFADDGTRLGVATPAWLYGIVATFADDPLDAPLGPWPTLGLLPAAWGEVPCAEPVAGGCQRYAGVLTPAAPLAEAKQTVRRQLVDAGYRIDTENCRPDGGCMYAAARFRALGGRDRVLITTAVTAVDAGHTRIQVLAGP